MSSYTSAYWDQLWPPALAREYPNHPKEEEAMFVEKRGSSAMDVLGQRAHEDDDGTASGMRTAETMLRLVPMALCVAALVVMLKNSQTSDYGSLSYSDLGAFRYLVHANGICAGYSLLSAIVVAMPRPSTMSRAWTFFLLDQILTYVILAAGAVSSEVLYLAYKGDTSITWSAACGSYDGFCRKATASVAITFVAVVCYTLLSLLSSYKLFSKYDAPVANPVAAAFGG
ncbi:CASP-like protein 2A1 [Alnus glutinosa]|uniref:CASP-like protein 2A1 n=1 Tax=Alnus glutinosa TaxID=3517 RepID=UPI002D76CDFE|nr:CASP-like protein 2A1 [Alnus glutinosa]